MGTTALFQAGDWEEMDAAPTAKAEGAALPFLFDLMDRVRAGIDAQDWPAVVLATEQLIERVEAGEYDPAAPVLMIGRQRYRGIVPEIVCQRFEHLREALRAAPHRVRDKTKARQRRAAPNAEHRAAKIIAQLNSDGTLSV